VRWCSGSSINLAVERLEFDPLSSNTNLQLPWLTSPFSQLGTKTRQCLGFRFSFICQGTGNSTRRQRSDLFGLRVKLPPVTTSITTQR